MRKSALSKRKPISSWMWSISMRSISTMWKKNWSKQTSSWPISWRPMSGSLPRSQTLSRRSSTKHHENVIKSAQQHQLAPGALRHNVLNGIIEHITTVAKKTNLVPFVTFASDLFQIEVSHLFSPATNEFILILHVPMVANSNLLNLYEFLHCQFASISQQIFQSLRTADK
jgi:hypothetical protein